MWFPLLLFGALTWLSVPVFAWGDGPALAVYWAVAGPVGGVATGYFYLRRQSVGLEVAGAPFVVVAVAILVGTMLAGWIGSSTGQLAVAAAGPPLVVSAGYLGFAWLDRSRWLAAVAIALAAVMAVLLVVGVPSDVLTMVGAALYGGAFVVTGTLCLLREARAA